MSLLYKIQVHSCTRQRVWSSTMDAHRTNESLSDVVTSVASSSSLLWKCGFPLDVLLLIFEKIPAWRWLRLMRVCKSWRNLLRKLATDRCSSDFMDETARSIRYLISPEAMTCVQAHIILERYFEPYQKLALLTKYTEDLLSLTRSVLWVRFDIIPGRVHTKLAVPVGSIAAAFVCEEFRHPEIPDYLVEGALESTKFHTKTSVYNLFDLDEYKARLLKNMRFFSGVYWNHLSKQQSSGLVYFSEEILFCLDQMKQHSDQEGLQHMPKFLSKLLKNHRIMPRKKSKEESMSLPPVAYLDDQPPSNFWSSWRFMFSCFRPSSLRGNEIRSRISYPRPLQQQQYVAAVPMMPPHHPIDNMDLDTEELIERMGKEEF